MDVARRAEAPALTLGALAFVLLAGVAGGASRQNVLPLAALELAALPLAAFAARRLARGVSGGWTVAAFLAVLIAIPAAQLIPLPPGIWTQAPGQSSRTEALRVLGLPLGWRPLSLFPRATLGCLLALTPPAAVALACVGLPSQGRRLLAGAWLVLGLAGLALGSLQLLQPAGGWAYLYGETNTGSLVGGFANRNHEAAFLLALLPMAAALAAPMAGGRSRAGYGAAAILPLAFAILALVALGVVRSRAGVVLAAPAVLGAFAILARGRAGRARLAAAVGVGAAALLLVAVFALTPLVERFAPDAQGEFRFQAWPSVVAAAKPFQPIGAGVGAFERVFRAAEPLDLVRPEFLNHAHNEYLEIWLETGWIGPAALVAFLVWFAMASARAWSRRGDSLARAGSLSVILLLAASSVDYPLRTETLACLFAFACACLAARPAPAP